MTVVLLLFPSPIGLPKPLFIGGQVAVVLFYRFLALPSPYRGDLSNMHYIPLPIPTWQGLRLTPLLPGAGKYIRPPLYLAKGPYLSHTPPIGTRYTFEGVFTGGLGIEVYILVTGGCGEANNPFWSRPIWKTPHSSLQAFKFSPG